MDSQLNLGKHFGEATSHQAPLFTLGLKTGNITLKIHLGDMSECGSQALVFVITGPSFSISLSKKTGFCQTHVRIQHRPTSQPTVE